MMSRTSADWTRVSRNPVAPEVHDLLTRELSARLAAPAHDYMAFVREFVTGKRVLDIGVVEHDVSHMEAEGWKHQYLREWSDDVLGVDILAAEIDLLKQRGFRVVQADATSEVDLGERFERVVIGDVIEHVEKPVALLRFAARHLEPGGLILVRTPNPYFYGYLLRHLREESLISNAEHLAWISPSMALELGRRADLELEAYHQLQPFGSSPVKRLLNALRNLFFRRSDLFAAAFFYVYRQPLS